MNLGIVYQVVGAIASIGAAFVLNVQLRPEFDTQYEAREFTEATGMLTLSRGGADTVEVPMMTTHVVTTDVVKLKRVLPIRELALRSAGDRDKPPRVEVFADLSRLGGDLAGGSHDLNVLLQTELPLLRAGRLGARRSYVSLDGTRASAVATGNLLFTEIRQVESGGKSTFQAFGRLEVQVETERGIELITGRFNGAITWDATGA